MKIQTVLFVLVGLAAVIFGLYNLLTAQNVSGLEAFVPLLVGAMMLALAFNINKKE